MHNSDKMTEGEYGLFRNAFRVLLVLLCMAIFVPSMPVNYFTVTGRGEVLYSCPMPNGYKFVTTYIHSLERTPVLDDYRFVSGQIWGWEEWTKSLNAGLPSAMSTGFKFVASDSWMITRGGRRSGAINYRVGTDVFGRNKWRLEPWDEINIFEKYPKFRLSFEATVVPFRLAAITGFDSLTK